MKKTAVEWLYEISQERELTAEDFEKALEMEKEQIELAFKDGWGSNPCLIMSEINYSNVSSIAYYKQRYGSVSIIVNE
jgi:hypothetical protein